MNSLFLGIHQGAAYFSHDEDFVEEHLCRKAATFNTLTEASGFATALSERYQCDTAVVDVNLRGSGSHIDYFELVEQGLVDYTHTMLYATDAYNNTIH